MFKYSTQSYTVGVWNKGGKRCTIILTDCAVSQVPWASGVQWLGVSCGWDPWGWTGGKSNGKKIGINFHLLLILHGKQVYNDSKQQQAIERMVLATTQDAYERVFVFLLSISIQKKGQPRAFSTTFKRRDPPGGVEDQYTVFTYWQRVKKGITVLFSYFEILHLWFFPQFYKLNVVKPKVQTQAQSSRSCKIPSSYPISFVTSRSTCNTCLIIDETGLWECIQEVWINKCQLNNIKYFQKRNGHHVLPSLCSARHLLAINLEQVEIVLYEWHSGVKSEKWASQLGWVTFEDQFRVENVRVWLYTWGRAVTNGFFELWHFHQISSFPTDGWV